MGLSFSPAVGKPSFELGEDEMELGLGIHGKPGVKRTQLQAADKLTETLLGEILKYGNFGEEKRVAVMVNNLGATTEMELAIIARHAVPLLASKGYAVDRIYAGTFLSSLDMAGISISVLGVNDEWLRWLDAPTTAPAWPNVPKRRPRKAEARIAMETSAKVSRSVGEGAQTDAGNRASVPRRAARTRPRRGANHAASPTLSAHMQGAASRNDIVVREIEVIPNGREQDLVFNGRLEGSAAHDLHFPAVAIPDATSILVRLYPGPLSQVIEGMDSILSMPGGCFEQTSSSTYPNVLALDYMKRTKKLTPEVHAKAEGYIANGYPPHVAERWLAPGPGRPMGPSPTHPNSRLREEMPYSVAAAFAASLRWL
jgi:hypothetical protein